MPNKEEEESSVQSWRDQLKKGLLELTALALLKKKPHYGYEIYKYMQLEMGIEIDIAASYPVLKRMKLGGFIEEFNPTKAQGNGRIRKYYSITALGKKRLEIIKKSYQKMSEGVEKLLG
jgi:PadR family transcriptional regulator PadR